MDVGELRGLLTVVAFVAYLGVVWWAYRAGNRERFERDARLPFEDDGGGGARPPSDTAGEPRR